MNSPLSDNDIEAIGARLDAARQVAALPWTGYLETAGGLGGQSFVQFGSGLPTQADEMYLNVWIDGKVAPSRDRRLDAIIDFVGHAPTDVAALLAEVIRLRGAA